MALVQKDETREGEMERERVNTSNGAQEAAAIRVLHEEFELYPIQDVGVGVDVGDCCLHRGLCCSTDNRIESKNRTNIYDSRLLAPDRTIDEQPYRTTQQQQSSKVSHNLKTNEPSKLLIQEIYPTMRFFKIGYKSRNVCSDSQ